MKHSKIRSSKVKEYPKKSLEARSETNATRKAISKVNVQDLINTKCKTSCNVKKRRKNTHKMNNPISIRTSEENNLKQGKQQRIAKSVRHFQINRRRQQNIYSAVHKYKERISKKGKDKFFRETLRKSCTNKCSKIAVMQSTKNDIVMYKNDIDNKQLTVPLIKIENLPLAELGTLIHNPSYVENRPKKERNKETIYRRKNITEARQSTNKQYRTTELKQNEEINVLYHKSVFKRSHTFFKENIIDGINVNVENIKFKTSECKISSNEVNTGALVNEKHNLKSTALLENVLKFFLKYKNYKREKKATRGSCVINSEEEYNCEITKIVALCIKCKEVFNLLQQFSAKISFIQDEKLCIECTLCNLQIDSLSNFQQHVMDIHLQCEKNSSTSRKRFVVDIVNINDELNLGRNKKCIYECCCCSKTFLHRIYFEKHISRMHNGFNYVSNNIKKVKAIEDTEPPELCTTYDNNQILQKENAVSRSLSFDMQNNMQQVSNVEIKETNVQNNNHINDHCINVKRTNFKNSMYYNSNNEKLLVTVEVNENQISDINCLNRKRTAKMKQNLENLNLKKHYTTTSRKISKISITSELKRSNKNTSNSAPYRKKCKQNFPYICNICCRNYKRKHMFLSHMSKHVANSSMDVYDQQHSEKCLKDNNTIKFNDNVTVENVYTNKFRVSDKIFTDNNTLNSSTCSEKLSENILTPEVIDKEVCSSKPGNMEHTIIKEDGITVEPTDNCSCVLHINLVHRPEQGIKRQKSMKFDISVAKKHTTDTNGPQNPEIENIVTVNFIPNTNLIGDENEKNVKYGLEALRCKICDKRFSSPTILKEHMVFLHDSPFENQEYRNLTLVPYFSDNRKIENVSTGNTHKCKKKLNLLPKVKISEFFQKKNITRGKAVHQIFSQDNTNNRSKKWRCRPCKENFALLRNYLRHKYYCHDDESVVHICDNCNKILTSVAMVNIHTCANVTSWHCKRCILDFPNALSLTDHNRNCHLETVGPHTCNICTLSFLTTYMLEKHKLIHSLNDNKSYNNLNNSRDSSETVKNSSPYRLINANEITLHNDKDTEPVNDVTVPFAKENPEIFKGLRKTNENCFETYLSSVELCGVENVFKCNLCNIMLEAKFEMILHLEKLHDIKMEICQICNDLYLTDKLLKHLIDFHIAHDTSRLMENSINIQVAYEKIISQNDILKVLGLKRLLSLYEYQRFDEISPNKHFGCMICSNQFSSIQSYKSHYFAYHDMCLLCNIEFKHNFQALEHKTKFHVSIDSYLWVVKKLTAAVLQFGKYGSTMEEVILKLSERKIY